MSKYAGPAFSIFLVDGFNLAAAVAENASMGEESITQQTNPFGVTSEEHTPIGIQKGTLNCGGGIFDAATDALHSAIGTVTGISRIVCAAIFGNTPGKPFMGFQGAYSQKYEVMDVKDGLTKANVQYLVSGSVDDGQIIQDLVAYTATWDTKTGGATAPDTPVDFSVYEQNRVIPITSNSIANPSVVTCPVPHGLTSGQIVIVAGVATSSPTINGSRTVTVISTTTFSVPVNVTVAGTGGTVTRASTTAGGVGYLQVTAFSGFSQVVVKIMHSPDDTTYAALITFTTVTAVTKERVTVAGTIDRYLSSQGTVTGSGSITSFSGLVRN